MQSVLMEQGLPFEVCDLVMSYAYHSDEQKEKWARNNFDSVMDMIHGFHYRNQPTYLPFHNDRIVGYTAFWCNNRNKLDMHLTTRNILGNLEDLILLYEKNYGSNLKIPAPSLFHFLQRLKRSRKLGSLREVIQWLESR
jgi:hypothetical protein